MAIMSMVKGLLEDVNKSLNADWQRKQLNETMKTVQDMRAETESLSQGVYCCDETPRPKKLGEGRVCLAYIAQSVERNQVRNSNRVGAWRRELMRTEALEQCCLLTCFSWLLSLFSYRTQDHQPGMATPTMGWELPHQLLIKRTP